MEINFKVVRRYLEGNERKGDKDQIIDWFSDIRFEKDIRRKFRTYWDELSGEKDLENCDGSVILGRIHQKIKRDEFRKKAGRSGVSYFFSVAQKVAAILFIPLIIYMWASRQNEFHPIAGTAYSEIYSPLGTRTKFHLLDGSTGWLNGGSYLKFPTEFRGRYRKVQVKGEAYFDVATDLKRPFVVKGVHTSAVAYGTSFNVQTYPGDSEARITLVSGEMSLFGVINGRRQKLADLNPDQMFIYNQDRNAHRVENVDAKTVTAWKEGKLVFRNEIFTSVVEKINRWYNVQLIIIDDALRSYYYQATFTDETLDEVLKLLQHSAPIKYKDLGRIRRPDGTFEKRKIELYYDRSYNHS